MMKLLKNKRIYTGEKVIPEGYIRYDRQIAEVGTMTDFTEQKEDTETVVKGDILIPGFIDVHSHGGTEWIIWMHLPVKSVRWFVKCQNRKELLPISVQPCPRHMTKLRQL